jgi:hypothetical protein
MKPDQDSETARKPEIGTYAHSDDAGDEPGIPKRPGLRRGPPAGWRMATIASSVLLLSIVAGMASLLAGALFLLPVAALVAPFLLRRKLRRSGAGTAVGGKLFRWRHAGYRQA